jgi:hypothetical protein
VDQAIWIGYGLLVGGCWILGLLALRASLRAGALLERGLAAVLLATGAVGCPLTFLPSLVALSPPVRAQVLAGGIAGLGVGSVALYITTWRFFRPRSVAAALVCSAGTFVIAWSFLAELLIGSFSWGRDRLWLVIGGVACWIPYVWGAVEMLHFASRPWRSQRSARSFRLYGVAQAAVAFVFVPGLASMFRTQGVGHPRLVVALVAAGAVVAALAAAQAFVAGQRPRSPGADA